MNILYIYIITVFGFNFISFSSINLMFSGMNMYATIYNNLVFFIYSVNVRYESVVEMIYYNYSLFKCADKKINLTAVKTVSNSATCSSPKDGAQIISNDYLLSTSDFL